MHTLSCRQHPASLLCCDPAATTNTNSSWTASGAMTKRSPSCQTLSAMSTTGSLYAGLSKLARTRGMFSQHLAAMSPHCPHAPSFAHQTYVKQDLEHELAAAAIPSTAASATSPAADAGELRLAAPIASSARPAQPTTCNLHATPAAAAAASAVHSGSNHQLTVQPERCGHAKRRQHLPVRRQQHTYAGRRAWVHPQKDQRLSLLAQHI